MDAPVAEAELGRPIIGVLCPYLAGPYNGAVLSAINRATTAAGAQALAVQTAGPGHQYNQERSRGLVARAGWGRIAGLLTIADAVPVAYLEAFRARTGKPVVTIGNAQQDPAWPAVTPSCGSTSTISRT